MLESKSKRYRYALLLAPIFLGLIGMRFNMAFLVWITFVPILIILRESQSRVDWLIVFSLLQLGLFVQMLKMYSDPLHFAFIPMVSVPAGAELFVLLLIYEKLRRKMSALSGIFWFASWMVAGEYINAMISPAGSWGALGYVLIDSQPIIQLSSLFGIFFVSYFIFLSNAFLAHYLLDKSNHHKSAFVSFSIFLLFYGYGGIRIDSDIDAGQLKVAAIVSDLEITLDSLPSEEALEKNDQTLFERTIQAADNGAKVVAWNEGATVVEKKEEPKFIEHARQIAKANSIYLYLAYVVPPDTPGRFENKYLFIDKSGEIKDTYFKHFPVPFEGSVKGREPLRVYEVEGFKLGGAICFDYDFIQMGKEHAANDVGLVVVPASDWKGIDPYHAKMAMVRGIENGYSILRPVRGATSIASDALGNIRASMSYFEKNDKIMLASLPTVRIVTLYSIVGDLFCYLQILISFVFAGSVLFRKRYDSKIKTARG